VSGNGQIWYFLTDYGAEDAVLSFRVTYSRTRKPDDPEFQAWKARFPLTWWIIRSIWG